MNKHSSISLPHPWRRLAAWVLAAAWLAACVPAAPQTPTPRPTPAGPTPLVVVTHDSFAASEGVITAFEQANNAKVQILKSGDAGLALNKVILSKDAPLGDVFYGVDNTLLSKAVAAGLFVTYRSPALAGENIPAAFQLDASGQLAPVDYGDICLNYDKAYFAAKALNPPQSLEDLAQPAYKDLLVVENPATSSPGLGFLLATISHFGAGHYLDFWQQLRQNGVKVVDGWETAYYTDFSGSSGKGPRPLVVSYASSPPAEVAFGNPQPTAAPTASLVSAGSCFRQVEFVGILKGAQHPDLAQKWVDFMLSQPFQADMPLQMFVFPVNPAAQLPEVFTRWAQIPSQPATLDPADIAAHREAWIDAWTKAVLQ